MLAPDPLPPAVRTRFDDFLRAVDAEQPGLVRAAYVVGSGVLDDWRPGSDIDGLVVTSVRPDHQTVDTLARLHAEQDRVAGKRSGQPYLDVAYVTWEDLAGPPDQAPADCRIWTDPSRLRAWTLTNLTD